MRTNVLAMLLVLLLPNAVHADRITQMNQPDLCIYIAKLQVAGYYYFEQGKAREEVKIAWHGDETQNEIDFVNRTLDDAYLWLTNAKKQRRRASSGTDVRRSRLRSMHERQAALTGAILVLTFLAAVPARAEKDAATKAQEGEINHWIEYYRKNRDRHRPRCRRHRKTVRRRKRKEERERGKGTPRRVKEVKQRKAERREERVGPSESR